jgi:hypothetical protein
MPSPLHDITLMIDGVNDQAYLQCLDHEKWEPSVDFKNLMEIVRLAANHIRAEHRNHVKECLCRDRVIDGRCIPVLGLIDTEMLQ